jgi:hypothetical protein
MKESSRARTRQQWDTHSAISQDLSPIAAIMTEPSVKETVMPLLDFLEANLIPRMKFSEPEVSADLKVLMAQVNKALFRQMSDQNTQTDE